MKTIYEYLSKNNIKIRKTPTRKDRFWLRAIDEVTIVVADNNRTFKVSLDGEDWENVNSYVVKPGQYIYINCGELQPNKIKYKIHSVAHHFNIGGDILGFISPDADYRSSIPLIPKNMLYEAFASSGVVDASQVSFDNVKKIGAYGCAGMFSHCLDLIGAPELPCTDLGECCYRDMFTWCEKLVNPPTELPATNLPNDVYDSMFSSCKSLIKSPVIYGKKYGKNIMGAMFYGCNNLSNIDCRIETDISYSKLFLWVVNVAPTGVFTKLKDVKITKNSDNGIPKGWTIKEI